MKTVELNKLNERTFNEANIDKVVMGFGSLESHGEHLPYGCDAFLSYDLAHEVAKKLDRAVVAPSLPYGMSAHYRHKPMCISISDETLIKVMFDMFESVLYWGINKIIIINGHDGNIAALEIATRQIRQKYPDANIALLEAYWITANNLLPKDTFEVWNGGGHGGEGETSLALSFFPELCDMSRAKGSIPDMDSNLKLIWKFSELSDHGASGAPEKATLEKGQKMREVLVNSVVEFVNKMETKEWKFGKL